MLSDALSAIDYAVVRGAQVINASWGGSVCSKSLQEKVAALANRNVLFVSAAGNDSLDIDQVPEFPAAFNLPSQLTVGAIDYFGGMTDFSNYGFQRVQLFAPGLDIYSTVPGGQENLSGTSMATPFVTGVVALVLGARPKASYTQVKQAITSAVDVNPGYYNSSQGSLNAYKAVQTIIQVVGQ